MHTHEPPAAMLSLLAEVIAEVSERHHLTATEAAEFAASVQLAFLQRDYDIFSSLTRGPTYRAHLAVVVTRMLFDWRERAESDRTANRTRTPPPVVPERDTFGVRTRGGVARVVAFLRRLTSDRSKS